MGFFQRTDEYKNPSSYQPNFRLTPSDPALKSHLHSPYSLVLSSPSERYPLVEDLYSALDPDFNADPDPPISSATSCAPETGDAAVDELIKSAEGSGNAARRTRKWTRRNNGGAYRSRIIG
jgi:hypothetical protein